MTSLEPNAFAKLSADTLSVTSTNKAEVKTPTGGVKLATYEFLEPPRGIFHTTRLVRLELCLTARHRSARGSYCGLWGANRLDRVGELFVALPDYDLLLTSEETTPFSAVVCELDTCALERIAERPLAIDEQNVGVGFDVRNTKLRMLLMWLSEELERPGFAGRIFVECAMDQIAIELIRFGSAVAESAPAGLASWQMRLIDERLNEIRRAPSLTELAALCRLSTRQLARGFKAVRGRSIGAYVAENQMQHAQRLLNSEQSLNEISELLGFASTSNFCAAFRRVTSVTPGQFRESLYRRTLQA